MGRVRVLVLNTILVLQIRSPVKVVEGRVVGVVVNQVVYLLNRASSMVGDSVLETEEGLVNTILLVPRLMLPEKVVAGRVVGTLLNHVLQPLYRVSNLAWLNTLSTLLALMNFKLLVYKDTSPAKVPPAKGI